MKTLLLSLLFSITPLYAGGDGDLVGNGAGLAENNFYYGLKKIPTLINSCLESPYCPVNTSQKEVLKRIQNIALKFNSDSDLLQFKSDESFFRDVEDQFIRIAKTDFYPGAPIYLNMDMIYQNGDVALSINQSIGILLHEFGHQTGIKSHGFLDQLAAQLVHFLDQKFITKNLSFLDFDLEMSIQNFKGPIGVSEISMGFRGKRRDMKPLFLEKIQCKRSNSKAVGLNIENPHWRRPNFNEREFVWDINLNGWMTVYCQDRNTSIWKESRDFTLSLKFIKEPYPDGVHRPVYSWASLELVEPLF